MFEVRCFHLGKVKGLFLGQGLFLEVPQIPGCCSGGLPTYGRWEPRTGLARATDLPDLLHLH